MFDLQTSDLVGVTSAGISLIALALNLLITQRQTRISFETLKFNNDTQVMNWANRVVVAMSEALHISNAANVSSMFLHERALALHDALGAGRRRAVVFSQIGRRPTDTDKPGAYRGSRQAILDQIVVVYESVNELQRWEEGPRDALAAKIGEAKRHFVSEVQHAVDPRRRAWVMDRFRKY